MAFFGASCLGALFYFEVLNMSKPFTVSIFTDIVPDENAPQPFFCLYDVMEGLFKKHESIRFLFCEDSRSDSFTSGAVSCARDILHKSPHKYVTVKVFPFSPKGRKEFEETVARKRAFYDGYLCFDGCDNGDERTAHVVRNEKMVEEADLAIFFIREENSLVTRTLKYAKALKKEILMI